MSAEELVAHGEWLRRLARALVGEAAADDVVQETYEVALTQGPRREGPIGPWLAGVARNVAKMRVRAGVRRERREEGMIVGEAPGPEELVERAKVQQRVATMVLALEEPFRSTLLLRYYEGLSAAEIARAQDVPAGTVRWRLKQALDRVRAALDEEHAGERRRWVLLMMPLAPMVPAMGDPAAGAAGSKLLMGGIAVKTGTKVAALVAVVIALLAGTRYAGLWGKGKGTSDGAAAVAKPEGGAGAVRPVTPVASESSAPASRVPMFRDDDPKGSLRLEGVVLDEAEQGVAGARVAIDAAPPMIVETDSDGSFVFQGLIARDYRVEATAGESYAGPARLRLTAKAEPVTLRLRKGGVVEVVVTDRAGGSPVEGAEVELRAALLWSGVSGADGVATLRGVGPTWAPVAVSAKGYAPAAVMVSTAGDPEIPSRVAIQLGRGAAVSGRVVDDAGKPVAGARVTAAAASEPFPVIDPRRDGVLSGGDGAFTLPALAAGSYRLTASDASHAATTSTPIVVDGATARGGFELVLSAGGVIAGVVTDSAGQPVAAADVRVVTRGHVDWRPRRQAFSGVDGRFVITGLPRRAVEVVAWHPTGASAITPADLVAKREHQLELVLDISGAITGTVVDPAGEPVGDAQVLAEPEVTMTPAKRGVWQVRGVQEAVTDAGGGFSFGGLPAGSYRVRAARPGAPERALWQGKGVSARPGDPPIKLTLTPDGGVTGKVAFADGTTPARFSIELNDGWAVPFASKDGSFSIDAPSGNVMVRIVGPGFTPKRVSAVVEDGKHADLGTVTVEAGRSVSGRVLDADGTPVAGAKVAAGTLLSGGGSELYIEDESINSRATETDASGHYELAGFPPRHLTVVAGKDGVGRSTSVPVPASKDSAVVDLILQPTGAVDGKLTRDGQPLGDTIVIANPIGAVSSNFFIATGPDGSFVLDALTPGGYFITPVLGGGGNRDKDMVLRTVEVIAGSRTRIDIDATAGKGQLTVTIKTDTGKPVAMAMVFTVQAKIDAPNLEALRDGSFLPPEMRNGATVMMYIRNAMGKPAVIEAMRPGEYTVCVTPLPIGDDPTLARAVAEDAERLPMKCLPTAVAAVPAQLEVVVPAKWTEKRAPAAAPAK